MAKQSKAQKDTVERVMHEFKEGELESGSGRKVKSRRQAIAIALNESGSTNRKSPKDNAKALKKTKAREKQSETRDELYAQARRRDIPGRSKMTKAELQRALAR